MKALRQSQKTPYTPAFVGGVVFFLCAVALVIWFGIKVSHWVQHQQTAPIKQVKLYGDFGHIQPGQLHSKLQQHLVGNYFKLDVDEVAAFFAATAVGTSSGSTQTVARYSGSSGD
jgi:cell division protein FtsQ